MTPSAGPAEVRRYTPYVETVTHSDGVSNDSIWDEPRARMRPWMHGEWVLASDYDTLAARCATQEQELAERDARIQELEGQLFMKQFALGAAEQSLAAMRERLDEAVDLLNWPHKRNDDFDRAVAAFLAKEPT